MKRKRIQGQGGASGVLIPVIRNRPQEQTTTSGGSGCDNGKVDCVIWENIQTLDDNYSVDENRNAMMVGPINTDVYTLYVPASSKLLIIE